MRALRSTGENGQSSTRRTCPLGSSPLRQGGVHRCTACAAREAYPITASACSLCICVMHHHPPLPFVHFAIHQSIGHHPVSYNARRMDEAQPRWLGLPRELGTDQISCLPATAQRGTTQGFPSRGHHGILSFSHPGYGAHRWSKNHISPVLLSIR